MILKLRTGIKENTSWKLIDHIEEVDYQYMDKPKKYDGTCIKLWPDKEDKTIVKMIIRFNTGLGKIIYTDDMVYIMNDNGKTCDTINV